MSQVTVKPRTVIFKGKAVVLSVGVRMKANGRFTAYHGCAHRHIGTYDSPFDAARHYKKFDSEYQKNKPSRKCQVFKNKAVTPQEIEDMMINSGETIEEDKSYKWQCVRCKKQYQDRIMPTQCTNCGSIVFNPL